MRDTVISKIKVHLEQYRNDLTDIARQTTDEFWEHHMLVRPSDSQPSALGCRVREKSNSFYLEWYFNRFRKKPDGSFQPLSQHIAKPAGNFSYSLPKLYSRAPQWEHEMIRRTESVFANLRRQNHQLTQIRRSTRYLDQLQSELDQLMATDHVDD